MVNVSVDYTGNLHCDATHGPSQSKIATDAPADNKGKGEAFSPTDLVATALGTCISTTMGIKAEELGAERNVERRTAPDRRASVRSSHSVAVEFTAPRGLGANRAQLPRAKKSAAGNQSPDEIFLGGLVRSEERRV